MLMKILQIKLACLRSPGAPLLRNENVVRMVELCFEFSRQPNLSELLRKMAEHFLMQMVLTLFQSAQALAAGLTTEPSPPPPIKPPPRGDGSPRLAGMPGPLEAGPGGERPVPLELTQSRSFSQGDSHSHATLRPFAPNCLVDVLRFLASLTDPGANANTEDTRILGLALVSVALETGGRSLSQLPELVEVGTQAVCKFILQNSQVSNRILLSNTLRVVFNLFITVKEHLKVKKDVLGPPSTS